MIALLAFILVGHLVLLRLHAKRVALRDARILELEGQREADLDETAATYEAMRREIDALRCGDVADFHEGELSPDRRAAFQAHLPTCRDCRDTLGGFMRLDAMFATATDPRKR